VPLKAYETQRLTVNQFGIVMFGNLIRGGFGIPELKTI
jgi:hypothetical protein